LLERRIVVGIEVVEADHLVAACKQALCDVVADSPVAPVTSTCIRVARRPGRSNRYLMS
jgi:hypothetical protein